MNLNNGILSAMNDFEIERIIKSKVIRVCVFNNVIDSDDIEMNTVKKRNLDKIIDLNYLSINLMYFADGEGVEVNGVDELIVEIKCKVNLILIAIADNLKMSASKIDIS